MTPLISLLIIVALSLLIMRIATVALAITGLSREVARFQARSAFTGVGFTTGEAETLVNHPVRRRIIMLLMILGNLGFVTALSSLLLTFIDTASAQERFVRLFWLGLGLGVLWFFGTSQWVDRRLSNLIEWSLRRWTDLDVRDYASLLHLRGDYGIVELTVSEEDWLADKRLRQLDLQDEGALVLVVVRPNGQYIGAPSGHTAIYSGDTLIVYGRQEALAELDERLPGPRGRRGPPGRRARTTSHRAKAATRGHAIGLLARILTPLIPSSLHPFIPSSLHPFTPSSPHLPAAINSSKARAAAPENSGSLML